MKTIFKFRYIRIVWWNTASWGYRKSEENPHMRHIFIGFLQIAIGDSNK